jgi:Protein of unknown function (DUF3987)
MIGVDFSGSFEEVVDEPETPKGNGHDQAAAWPVMDPAAYHGFAGEVVARILPDTESDPVALLLQYLVSFGNAIGRRSYYLVEQDRHFTNLFAVLVGKTSKSRKGTSAGRIRAVFKMTDDADWVRERILGGMSSGEGVISAVRDPVYAMKKGVEELVDPGVTDKRLLLDEREFFQALAVLKREGSILSRVIREAWDCCEQLATLTKHSPTRATQPFISIVGHITADELRQALDHTSMANGYANRFLFACVRRSKLLPHGGALDETTHRELGARTSEALTVARMVGQVTMTQAGAQRWKEIYPKLSEGLPGLLGAITDRGEAQTIRLALLYALLDRASQIDVMHLDAASALWSFCLDSARYIFGDLVGDPVADSILRALRAAGTSGLMRTDLINLFGRNLAVSKIDAGLVALLAGGKVRRESVKRSAGSGRPREMWYAT